jgi:hypothetical protein
MSGLHKFFLCLCVYITAVSLIQGQVHVGIQTSRDQVFLGDTFLLSIKIAVDKDAVLLGIDTSGIFVSDFDIDIHTAQSTDTIVGDHATYLHKTYVLIAFDTGYVSLGPVWVSYKYENDELIAKSEPTEVYVGMNNVFPQDNLAPDEELIRVPPRNWTWLWISLIIGVLLLLFLLIYLWKKRPKVQPLNEVQPIVYHSPEEIAIKRLLQLKNEEGHSDEAYFEILSLTCRQYLFKRFSIKAMESTTEEIIQSLDHAVLKRHIPLLRSILRGADNVKYGKGQVLSQYREVLCDELLLFIRRLQNEIGDGI